MDTKSKVMLWNNTQRARLMFDSVRYENIGFHERLHIFQDKYGVSEKRATDYLLDIKEWEIYYQKIGEVFEVSCEIPSIKFEPSTAEDVDRLGIDHFRARDSVSSMSRREITALLFDSILIRDDGSYMTKTWSKAHQLLLKFVLTIPEWQRVHELLKEVIRYVNDEIRD